MKRLERTYVLLLAKSISIQYIKKKELEQRSDTRNNKQQQLQQEIILKFVPRFGSWTGILQSFPGVEVVCILDLGFPFGLVQEKPLQNSREVENILERI